MARRLPAMEFVHMLPPSSEPVVTFPHKEHLAYHVGKVCVECKMRIESGIGFFLEFTLGRIYVVIDIHRPIKVVVDGYIHNVVAVLVACDEFVIKALHIYLIDRSNKRQSMHAA